MTDITRESFCKWEGWDELDYASIFDPMDLAAGERGKVQWTLDRWIFENIGADIGVGLIKTVGAPGIWKWFCNENGKDYPNSRFDIPFSPPDAPDDVLLFRRNRFFIRKPGEALGVGMSCIDWITWIDTEELEPNGFFFYKKSDKLWWEQFWPDDMILFIDLG